MEPFDPMCERLASEMAELDDYREDLSRAEYVIENDGTYNPTNGHFLCDNCYIKAGQPTSENGWVCP